MLGERIIYYEELCGGVVEVRASAEITPDLLDGLDGFVARQRARIDAELPTAEDVRGLFTESK